SRHRPGTGRAALHLLLHHQVERDWTGALDSALDSRGSRGHDTGGDAPGRGRELQLYPARTAHCPQGGTDHAGEPRRPCSAAGRREPMIAPAPTVHVVDDDDSMRTALTRLLRAKGYET